MIAAVRREVSFSDTSCTIVIRLMLFMIAIDFLSYDGSAMFNAVQNRTAIIDCIEAAPMQ